MTTRDPDVLILGGGPAGSTVASLVKKYQPHADVLVCEQSRFPRHHIGESLVADVNRLLYDIGAYDAVARAGFVRKYGSTFIWGRDRQPWSIEFAKLGEIPGYASGAGYQTEYTWHVRRDEYDRILLDHSRELGATVLEGTGAEVIFDGDRAAEVVLTDGRRLHPRFVIDATGQNSQVALRRAQRVFDPELRNIAVYGYFEGAQLDERLSGTWERSRIAVVSVAEGWIWYIPLAPGLLSVGVVTSRDVLAKSDRPLAAFLDGAIAGCAELQPLLAGARRVRFSNADAEVLAIRDYCYSVTPLHGPGWALVGDAAGFVDPILSIGCYLAHSGGQWLAYALNTLLAGDAPDEALCWRAFEEQLQFQLAAFRRMTYMFYGFNESKESWWWEAKRILRERALPRSVDQKAAFLAIATGYGINRPVYHEAISDFGVNIFDDLYRNLVAPGTILKEGVRQGAAKRFHRTRPFQVAPWMVPVEEAGKMRQVFRVTFAEEGPEDGPAGGPADGAVQPSRLLLPAAYVRFLEALDGRTAGEALATLPAEEAELVRGRLDAFLTGLVHLGVVAPSP